MQIICNFLGASELCRKDIIMKKSLLTITALAATAALGIGSFNLAYAAETEDTSSGKK